LASSEAERVEVKKQMEELNQTLKMEKRHKELINTPK
jgi:hypothetical protein